LSHHKKKRVVALGERLLALCPEREIFLRSGGQVKFIHISRRVQIAAVGLTSALLLGWVGATVAMLSGSASVAQERAALTQKSRSVATAATKVDGYRKSVENLAQDLEARQDFMDDLYKTHFGSEDDKAVGTGMTAPTKADKTDPLTAKISMAPEAAPLVQLEQRQRQFAALLTVAVERRADKAAAAIRSFGLNPDEVDGSRSRHLSAKMGLLSCNPRRSHPPWRLARSASIWPRTFFRFTVSAQPVRSSFARRCGDRRCCRSSRSCHPAW
jgi:hypothetical protein